MSASVEGRNITERKSFVYVGTICRQDKRLGRAWLGEVSIPRSSARWVFQKKRVAIFKKKKTIVCVACQQALHLG